MKKIYFDHSATTPVDNTVAEKMLEVMTGKFGNPSSVHSTGKEANHLLDESRHVFADMLKCDASEICFTSGGTEADNLALMGTVEPGQHLITTAIEHHAILYTAEYLAENGRKVTFLKPDRYGMISPESVETAITGKTRLVSVMHVNNESGTINPVETIAEIVKSRGILFHVDAVQSFGKLPVDLSVLPADLLSISGHKIYGPKGVGALFVRKGTDLKTRTFGGHHERGLRAGTENMPGIIGFAAAAEICRDLMRSDAEKIGTLRDRLWNKITEQYSEIVLNGHPAERLYSLLNVSFPDIEGETMLMNLDLNGISVSTGSACSSGSTSPSHVLTAMGISPEMAHSSIRFSLGRSNTADDIDYAVIVISEIIDRLKAMSF